MKYIIGIGSWVNGDDSIGLYLAEEIQKINKNSDLEVVILNQEILSLLTYLQEDFEKILIIDALETDLEAGEWRIFSFEEVENLKITKSISTHEGNLLTFLTVLKALKINLDKVKFFGIKPYSTEPGYGLSEILNKNFNTYIQEILKEIEKP
ncbi:MAG: hydrogenase maturation protease [Thermoanaerobaculia bacterium]